MDASAIVLVLGVVFALLGGLLVFCGYREEKKFVDDIAQRPDARKFLNQFPPAFEAGGLKVGGFIALAVSGVLFIMGLLLLFVL